MKKIDPRLKKSSIDIRTSRCPNIKSVLHRRGAKGAYVISEAQQMAEGIIITGSEVTLAIAAQKILAKRERFVKVVIMPSWELVDRQPKV